MTLFLQSGKNWAIMILISMSYNFWGLILKCNEQERRLLEFFIAIVVVVVIICRFVCTAALPYESQRREDCLEKKSSDVAEKVR